MVAYYPYQTKNGRRWLVSYRTPNHRQTKKRGFTRKLDAQRWAAANVTTAEANGTYTPASVDSLTISQLWDKTWETRSPTWKPYTRQDYTECWRLHVKPAVGSLKVKAFTHQRIQQFLTSLNRHPGIVRTSYEIIKLVWREAVQQGVNRPDPTQHLILPKRTQGEHHYLTMQQLVKLADAAEHYGKRTLVLTLGLTGLRWGELAALQVKDIDIKGRRIHVRRNAVYANRRWNIVTPKSGRSRTIPIPTQLTYLLDLQVTGKTPDDLVFPPDRKSRYIHDPSGRQTSWWSRSLDKAGLPHMGVHSLRHTAASLAVASGADVKVVQNMMGHASAAMTLDVYADLFDGKNRDVADRLGAMLDQASK